RPESTLNPTFELAYWAFGLETALKWRRRLNLPPEPKWERVLTKLVPLPVAAGVYLAHERCPETFTQFNIDHPSLLGALGMLPGWGVDRTVMAETLRRVLATWKLESAWGWDFPLMALTAARLGEEQLAVELLLYDSPKNTYLPNGHNRQATREDLPLYLPGNGGLLTAVAMMAAGWEGGPQGQAPGFPQDGSWEVTWEGLRPML
ncbi:MAG: glycoside hydrolase family 65, partial [Firmicutes bacterium]|nr:glycoside hydrolase family 65 [Bacillota bacterium]